MLRLPSVTLAVAVLCLLAAVSVDGQLNFTEGWCVSITGLSASTPFAVTWRLALAYQQTLGSAQVQNVQVAGTRHLATPTTSVDTALTGVSSSTVNWTTLYTQVQGSYVNLVSSLLDPASLACPYPSICQTSRSFSTSSQLPTPLGGLSSGSQVNLVQLQVTNPINSPLYVLQEDGDSLGPSVAIASSYSQLVSVTEYASPNTTLPYQLLTGACPIASPPTLTAGFLCLQQADPLSSYGTWAASASLIFSYVSSGSESFNPANPFANFNNTGEAVELAATTALPVQDVTGMWNLSVQGVGRVARVLGFSYSALAGSNPNYPLAAATQPFLYSNAFVLDSAGWQMQLDNSTVFPDGAQSSLLRLGYFNDTQQWFTAYRADQQVAFGSSFGNQSLSSSLYAFSPYVNRGAVRACGGLPGFTPTRYVGPDTPSMLLTSSTVRVGLWGQAMNYSLRTSSFPTPGQLAMQLLTVSQAMSISALGVVSSAIESNIRLGLYTLPAGQPFPSSSSWTLLAETTRINAIPTRLYTTTPYTIEIPLSVSSPISLSAGQLVAIVIYRYGATMLMPGLVAGGTGVNRTTLYPAQFVDLGPAAIAAGFVSFAASLPTVSPSRLFAAGLDSTQMAAFLVGQTSDGSAFVDNYASVVVSPSYAAALYRPSSSSSSSSTAPAASVTSDSVVESPVVSQVALVQYVTNNDNSWSAGTIAAFVIALVVAGLVCCLLLFIAFRLARGGDLDKGRYSAVPAGQQQQAYPPVKPQSPMHSGVEMQHGGTPGPVVPTRPTV